MIPAAMIFRPTHELHDAGWPPAEDYCGLVGGRVVGRVMRIGHGPSEGQWKWSLTAVRRPPAGRAANGVAPSREEAEAALAACLAAAGG